MNKILGVVPARMGSSRFYGKPLVNINGIPMIAHCYFRSLQSKKLNKVVLATPDDEILNFAKSYNIEAIKTSHQHERASERAGEVLDIFNYKGIEYDYVLLLQGDEPQISPLEIDKLATRLIESKNSVVNLVHPIQEEDMKNPNVVKAVSGIDNNILFFSRAHIPHNSTSGYRQLGMIGFKSNALKKYCSLKPTKLEVLESIDMMRMLENNIKVESLISNEAIIGVDHPEDIQKVELLMKKDELVNKYSSFFKAK